MLFLNGFIYGSGFMVGAFVVNIVMKAVFHIGFC